MSTLQFAALQMVSTPHIDQNLNTAGSLIAQAASQGAQVVVLPEYFAYMGREDTSKLAVAESHGDGPMQSFIAEAAQCHGVYIVAGTLPLQCDAEHVYNSTLVYSPQGECIYRYDKIHLFHFQRGNESYDEARTLKAGTQPVVAEILGLRIGLSVCYDLRFPELYRSMLPLDVIVVPAAFTYTTGQAHWEVLLRARAIENQCYVLACGQGGAHPTGRRTFGHSMWVGPWGDVENVLPEGEGVVLGTYNPTTVQDVRTCLPAHKHRVLSIFGDAL